jgi:hypothetical protein
MWPDSMTGGVSSCCADDTRRSGSDKASPFTRQTRPPAETHRRRSPIECRPASWTSNSAASFQRLVAETP